MLHIRLIRKTKKSSKTQYYSKKLTEKVVRKTLHIPSKATIKITYGKAYYKEAIGKNLIPVTVKGTGKYKGYHANGDFLEDGSNAMSMLVWIK